LGEMNRVIEEIKQGRDDEERVKIFKQGTNGN
jgi:hypothetical protein